MDDDRKVTFGHRADLNKVASVMDVVEALRRGEADTALEAAEAGGVSDELVQTLVALGETGLLDQLVSQLDGELLYDKYNPKLYYF